MIYNFINAFKCNNPSATEDLFLNGNCYWFAVILSIQFPGGEIMYDAVENHFLYKYDDALWDISGDVSNDYLTDYHGVYKWDNYENVDYLDYQRVKYYCKDLGR